MFYSPDGKGIMPRSALRLSTPEEIRALRAAPIGATVSAYERIAQLDGQYSLTHVMLIYADDPAKLRRICDRAVVRLESASACL